MILHGLFFKEGDYFVYRNSNGVILISIHVDMVDSYYISPVDKTSIVMLKLVEEYSIK